MVYIQKQTTTQVPEKESVLDLRERLKTPPTSFAPKSQGLSRSPQAETPIQTAMRLRNSTMIPALRVLSKAEAGQASEALSREIQQNPLAVAGGIAKNAYKGAVQMTGSAGIAIKELAPYIIIPGKLTYDRIMEQKTGNKVKNPLVKINEQAREYAKKLEGNIPSKTEADKFFKGYQDAVLYAPGGMLANIPKTTLKAMGVAGLADMGTAYLSGKNEKESIMQGVFGMFGEGIGRKIGDAIGDAASIQEAMNSIATSTLSKEEKQIGLTMFQRAGNWLRKTYVDNPKKKGFVDFNAMGEAVKEVFVKPKEGAIPVKGDNTRTDVLAKVIKNSKAQTERIFIVSPDGKQLIQERPNGTTKLNIENIFPGSDTGKLKPGQVVEFSKDIKVRGTELQVVPKESMGINTQKTVTPKPKTVVKQPIKQESVVNTPIEEPIIEAPKEQSVLEIRQKLQGKKPVETPVEQAPTETLAEQPPIIEKPMGEDLIEPPKTNKGKIFKRVIKSDIGVYATDEMKSFAKEAGDYDIQDLDSALIVSSKKTDEQLKDAAESLVKFGENETTMSDVAELIHRAEMSGDVGEVKRLTDIIGRGGTSLGQKVNQLKRFKEMTATGRMETITNRNFEFSGKPTPETKKTKIVEQIKNTDILKQEALDTENVIKAVEGDDLTSVQKEMNNARARIKQLENPEVLIAKKEELLMARKRKLEMLQLKEDMIKRGSPDSRKVMQLQSRLKQTTKELANTRAGITSAEKVLERFDDSTGLFEELSKEVAETRTNIKVPKKVGKVVANTIGLAEVPQETFRRAGVSSLYDRMYIGTDKAILKARENFGRVNTIIKSLRKEERKAVLNSFYEPETSLTAKEKIAKKQIEEYIDDNRQVILNSYPKTSAAYRYAQELDFPRYKKGVVVIEPNRTNSGQSLKQSVNKETPHEELSDDLEKVLMAFGSNAADLQHQYHSIQQIENIMKDQRFSDLVGEETSERLGEIVNYSKTGDPKAEAGVGVVADTVRRWSYPMMLSKATTALAQFGSIIDSLAVVANPVNYLKRKYRGELPSIVSRTSDPNLPGGGAIRHLAFGTTLMDKVSGKIITRGLYNKFKKDLTRGVPLNNKVLRKILLETGKSFELIAGSSKQMDTAPIFRGKLNKLFFQFMTTLNASANNTAKLLESGGSALSKGNFIEGAKTLTLTTGVLGLSTLYDFALQRGLSAEDVQELWNGTSEKGEVLRAQYYKNVASRYVGIADVLEFTEDGKMDKLPITSFIERLGTSGLAAIEITKDLVKGKEIDTQDLSDLAKPVGIASNLTDAGIQLATGGMTVQGKAYKATPRTIGITAIGGQSKTKEGKDFFDKQAIGENLKAETGALATKTGDEYAKLKAEQINKIKISLGITYKGAQDKYDSYLKGYLDKEYGMPAKPKDNKPMANEALNKMEDDGVLNKYYQTIGSEKKRELTMIKVRDKEKLTEALPTMDRKVETEKTNEQRVLEFIKKAREQGMNKEDAMQYLRDKGLIE